MLHRLLTYSYITLSSVYYYSTAATSDAAYVIGGYQDGIYSTTIVEFKNNLNGENSVILDKDV